FHSAEVPVVRMCSECGGQESLNLSSDMVKKEGQSVNLECSEKKSNNVYMYWYMLPSQKNSRLILVASAIQGSKAEVEKGFEDHFKSSDIKGDRITLSIEHAFLNDSGTYYCAESEHSGAAAEGAEHKLVPAQTGALFHLMGAA
uniref:Ig-like domain-containing protein n=1 Tax=Zosterops lateralis melanops TaxID=1220523 RepID=A0A8D2P250_ZOSLA